jgi:transposase
MQVTTIGLDIAKSVFQVHSENASGKIVLQKRLRRGQVAGFFAKLAPAIVGIEACGTAHYWGRTLRALGHEVRLIPAAYVKPFVRRNKTDARDAAAICAALGRPDMRFVAIKSIEQQAARGVERARELMVKQRTQLMNCLRSQLAEFGIVAAPGGRGFAELTALVAAEDAAIPALLCPALRALLSQIERLQGSIIALEAQIMTTAKTDPVMRRLATIPGIGGLTAHAIVTAIGDGKQFRTARDFAAGCGLTPREHASAGKRRESGISRQGDIRLRKLLALGASTIMRYARRHGDRATQWQHGIRTRRPVKVAVLAQAAKTARIAWAMLISGETYRRPGRVACG